MVHGLEEPADGQVGELAGVDGVVLVAALGDPGILAGVADDQPVDVGLEVAGQPRGQRPFLEGQVTRPPYRGDGLTQGGDRGGHLPRAPGRVGAGLDADLGRVAVRVHGDMMLDGHGAFSLWRLGAFGRTYNRKVTRSPRRRPLLLTSSCPTLAWACMHLWIVSKFHRSSRSF